MRLAYSMMKKRFGKVMTPAKVVYARVPESLKTMKAMADFQEKGVQLDKELAFLVKTYVAGINQCAFCVDIGQAMAVQSGIDIEKFKHLHEYPTYPGFSARDRAALDYVAEATRNKTVSDETFARLQEHFSEREIVELTMLNAIENFYNLINVPLEIESDGFCTVPATNLLGQLQSKTAHG
jgi:AhpD family alkylhydroperoxidase